MPVLTSARDSEEQACFLQVLVILGDDALQEMRQAAADDKLNYGLPDRFIFPIAAVAEPKKMVGFSSWCPHGVSVLP